MATVIVITYSLVLICIGITIEKALQESRNRMLRLQHFAVDRSRLKSPGIKALGENLLSGDHAVEVFAADTILDLLEVPENIAIMKTISESIGCAARAAESREDYPMMKIYAAISRRLRESDNRSNGEKSSQSWGAGDQ